MRLARERILPIGLAALDAAAERVIHGVPMQGPGLRAALALLYTVSDGRKAAFDAFWAACGRDAGGRDKRTAALHAARLGIERALGFDRPPPPDAPAAEIDAARAYYRRLLNPPKPTRSGGDTRMQAGAGVGDCGWL